MLVADKCQVALKIEATAGTAETLAAANVIMTTDKPTWDPDVEAIERNVLSASVDSRGLVFGLRRAKISFSVYQRGTTGAIADPANLPDWSQPVKACGCAYTVSGGAGSEIMTVAPASLAIATQFTATIAIMRDGKQYQIHGAMGNVKKTYTVAAPVRLDFEFQGIYNAPTDVPLFAPTYPAVVEPPFVSAALTVVGYASARIKAMSIDLGNKIGFSTSPGTASGIYRAVVTGRNVTGSIDVEEELAATKNWFAEWLASTTGSIATGAFPSTGSQYNKINDTYPKVQYKKVGQGDRDGILISPLDFICRANSDGGNDSFSWVQQ